MKTARISGLKLTFTAALLAFGCESVLGIQDWTPKPTAGQSCTLNTDCATDLVCVFAHCSIACRSDRDCSGAERCLTVDDGTSGCVSPEQASCATNACVGGTECVGGQCRTPCSAGCRTDQACEGDVCVGLEEPGSGSGGNGASGGRAGGSSAAGGKGGSGATGQGGTKATGGDAGELGSGGTSSSAGGAGEGGEAGRPETGAGGGGGKGGGAGKGGSSGSGGKSGSAGSAGSTPDPCVGVACETPPATSCKDTSTLRTYGGVGSCSAGECTYSPTDTPCQFGCAAAACKGDPCTGVACSTPPANHCQDSGHLVAYDTTGNCSSGSCSYSSSVIACTCTGNACVNDPCATVVCDSPPASTCSGANTRRTFASAGTCSAGSCSYTYTDTACAFGCAGGACNADPCASISCNSPPAASCPDSLTLRTYNSSGTCSNGTCSYGHLDTPCAQQCSTSSGAHCACNPGYSGSGVVCNDDNECTLDTDDCDSSPAASCSNTPGSFDCSCPAPYLGTGHGANGCTCPSEPLCDSASEQNGSYCASSSTRVTCSSNNGCQQAASTTCANLALEKCVGSYPSSVCEQVAGFPTDGGSQGTLASTTLFAVPFTLTQPLTLTRIGLIAKAASSGVRLAVYAADGSGALATYKASATTGTIAAGRNEYAVTDPPSSSPVTLAAGNYWIAVAVQASTQLAQGGSGSVRYNVSWSPWDKSFPAGTLTTAPDTLARVNLYVVGKP